MMLLHSLPALLFLSAPAAARPLVRVEARAPGLPEVPCATPLLLPDRLPPPDLPPLAAPPAGAKPLREALQGVASVRTSENFAVKWGSEGGVTESTAQDLLDSLEQSWLVEMVEMGHPEPAGADRYKLNVYIEDTGVVWDNGSSRFELEGSGASGYYYTDPDGYPMLVMSQGALRDAEYAGMVAAHELYHAVQDGTRAYPYGGVSAWYWEASATWVSGEVFPDVTDYSVFLFGYLLLPWLPVDFFDYPDTGALQEYHQYGAFLYLRHLTEHVADWTVVRDSWTEPDPQGDPLDALDVGLAAFDSDVQQVLVGMAAHVALWDFAHGDTYAANVAAYDELYPEGSLLVGEQRGDSDGWQTGPEDERPQRLGFNLLAIQREAGQATTVHFAGDSEGSQGSPAGWAAWLVLDRDGGPVYQPLELTQDAGSVELPADEEAVDLFLAVTPTSTDRTSGEQFGWSWSVEGGGAGDGGSADGGADSGDAPGQPFDPDQPQACGCASARPMVDASDGAASLWAGLLGLVLLFVRGRRARAR